MSTSNNEERITVQLEVARVAFCGQKITPSAREKVYHNEARERTFLESRDRPASRPPLPSLSAALLPSPLALSPIHTLSFLTCGAA